MHFDRQKLMVRLVSNSILYVSSSSFDWQAFESHCVCMGPCIAYTFVSPGQLGLDCFVGQFVYCLYSVVEGLLIIIMFNWFNFHFQRRRSYRHINSFSYPSCPYHGGRKSERCEGVLLCVDCN